MSETTPQRSASGDGIYDDEGSTPSGVSDEDAPHRAAPHHDADAAEVPKKKKKMKRKRGPRVPLPPTAKQIAEVRVAMRRVAVASVYDRAAAPAPGSSTPQRSSAPARPTPSTTPALGRPPRAAQVERDDATHADQLAAVVARCAADQRAEWARTAQRVLLPLGETPATAGLQPVVLGAGTALPGVQADARPTQTTHGSASRAYGARAQRPVGLPESARCKYPVPPRSPQRATRPTSTPGGDGNPLNLTLRRRHMGNLNLIRWQQAARDTPGSTQSARSSRATTPRAARPEPTEEAGSGPSCFHLVAHGDRGRVTITTSGGVTLDVTGVEFTALRGPEGTLTFTYDGQALELGGKRGAGLTMRPTLASGADGAARQQWRVPRGKEWAAVENRAQAGVVLDVVADGSGVTQLIARPKVEGRDEQLFLVEGIKASE
jgi:hypothetical protein